MISMKRNPELFFILELLLLTPIALFWVGLFSMLALGSESLFMAIVGEPYSELRSILVTIVSPIASAWFAYEYMRENKKGVLTELAGVIIVVSLATVAIVGLYLFSENLL